MNKKIRLLNVVLLRLIDYSLFYLLYPILIFFPIKSKKIVVSNFWGKGYGDNPKYIIDYLLSKNMDLDIVWLCSPKIKKQRYTNFPETVRLVKNNSFKALIELHTAKIWIDNCRKNFHPRKRKQQYYIQTWHAGFGLKKIESDIEHELPKRYVRVAKKDSQMCDLMVFEHSSLFKDLEKIFWYHGEFYRNGIPKNDPIVNNNPNSIKKVYSYYNLPEDHKILLYAPTFRDRSELRINLDELEKLRVSVVNKFGFNYILLLRVHPNDVSMIKNITSEKNKYSIVLANDYDDMQELLCATDILITDYSSTIGEMLISNKKCFLYAYDYGDYMSNRGLVLDLYDLPFPVATSHPELIKKIETFDCEQYKIGLDFFKKKYDIYESGQASKEIGDRIIKEIMNTNYEV